MLTIDTESPSNIVGRKTFMDIYNSYPRAIALQLRYESSSKKFEFGGGEITKSLGKVYLPIYIKDNCDDMLMMMIGVEVVECDIIFLLGAESLEKAGAIFDISESSLTLKKAFGNDISFPVMKNTSGHYRLPFFTMTDEEGRQAEEIFFSEFNWSEEYMRDVIKYVQSVETPKIDLIMAEKVFSCKRFKRKLGKKKKKNTIKLSRKHILKLHHVFGHCHPEKLKPFLERSGHWTREVQIYLDELKECEVCKLEGRRLPKPMKI